MSREILKQFYKRVSCGDTQMIIDEDNCEFKCLFTGRCIDNKNNTTILPLNEFMPNFDLISLHNLGDICDKMYKLLWIIDMSLNYSDWLLFVESTNNVPPIFTCECKDLKTGVRRFVPIFDMGRLGRGSWEYSIENYDVMTNFKWGSVKVLVNREICKIRIRIEDVVVR